MTKKSTYKEILIVSRQGAKLKIFKAQGAEVKEKKTEVTRENSHSRREARSTLKEKKTKQKKKKNTRSFPFQVSNAIRIWIKDLVMD